MFLRNIKICVGKGQNVCGFIFVNWLTLWVFPKGTLFFFNFFSGKKSCIRKLGQNVCVVYFITKKKKEKKKKKHSWTGTKDHSWFALAFVFFFKTDNGIQDLFIFIYLITMILNVRRKYTRKKIRVPSGSWIFFRVYFLLTFNIIVIIVVSYLFNYLFIFFLFD